MCVVKTRQTKDGRCWIFQQTYTNLLGEKKRYSSPKYKTKKEAVEKERLYLLSLNNEKVNCNNMTFLDLYNKYIETQKNNVKLTTMSSYIKRWEYIKILSNVKLSSFDTAHYEMWRKNLENCNFSVSYKNDIQKFLKILLNFATKWYELNFSSIYNKMTNFNDPNAPLKEEMLFFTYDEFKQFRNSETELKYQVAFDILYFCGLRRGELVGLRWSNVDFIRKEIRIRDNAVLDRINGGYAITSPKTKKSIRNIPIKESLLEELKKLKEENKKVYGFKENWFVLGYDEPIPFSRLRERKNKICDLSGVKRIRLHDFRHSCASLLISKGANITLVARYLGHTKIDETLNTYSHFYQSDLDNIVSTLEELI